MFSLISSILGKSVLEDMPNAVIDTTTDNNIRGRMCSLVSERHLAVDFYIVQWTGHLGLVITIRFNFIETFLQGIQQGLRTNFWPTHYYRQTFIQHEINSRPTRRLTRSIEVLGVVVEQ